MLQKLSIFQEYNITYLYYQLRLSKWFTKTKKTSNQEQLKVLERKSLK